MIEFEQALLRLKSQVGIATDKEMAELLGLGEKALNARKRRGSFPTDKLRALAQQRPDLNIDVEHVLYGAAFHEKRIRAVADASVGAAVAGAALSGAVISAVGMAGGSATRALKWMTTDEPADAIYRPNADSPSPPNVTPVAPDIDQDTKTAIELVGEELIRQGKIVDGKELLKLVEQARRYIRQGRELERRQEAQREKTRSNIRTS